MNFDFSEILMEVVRQKASDLHLTSGSPPMLRKRGQLVKMEGLQNLTPTDTREIIYTILNSSQRQRLETDWQLDFAYSVPGHGRFRVNAYFQRGSLGAAFRLIPNETVPIEKLGLPPVVRGFATKPRGIVLVTGPTGSGKSTTLASIVNEINETRDDHILTIEDPIEFLHSHKKCIVNQREIGTDAQSFAMGLKAALRQDPDVILVGEMRDMETIGTALTAAETGHLVFATLHTQDAPQTVDRIIDVFPPEQQGQVRAQLSIGLQGIVTQTLVPTADGNGRCVAAEVLVPTPGVRNLIREGKTHQIYSLIQTGAQHGMQTMDASLAGLVKAGHITMAMAETRSEPARRAAPPGRERRQPAAAGGCLMASAALQFAYKGVDGAGLPQEGMITGVSEAAVMQELKAKGLQIMRLDEKKLRRQDGDQAPAEARQGGRAHDHDPPAGHHGLLGHDAPARVLRPRGPGREPQAQGHAVRRPRGHRGRPELLRRAREAPQGLRPALRRHGARRRGRRRARGVAGPHGRPAREGRLAAPPGQGRDDVPGRRADLRAAAPCSP